MPRAGPSRSQRQFSQAQNRTQTQRYARSQRRVEEEDDEEEIALPEDDEPEANNTGTVREAPWLTKKPPNQTRIGLEETRERFSTTRAVSGATSYTPTPR